MLIKVVGQPIQEEWLPVVGFIGYEVSNLGLVRSYRSPNGRGPLAQVPRPVLSKPARGKRYLRAALSDGAGKTSQLPIHLLVLTAFRGPRPTKKHDGCHNDGVAENNSLRNLRWGTKQSNADDRTAHGKQIRGTQVSLSVLTEDQVIEIKAAIPSWKKGMGRYFAQKFGVGDSAVSAIKSGLTWRHL